MILVNAFELLLVALLIIAVIYLVPCLAMGICILLAIWAAIMARKEGRNERRKTDDI